MFIISLVQIVLVQSIDNIVCAQGNGSLFFQFYLSRYRFYKNVLFLPLRASHLSNHGNDVFKIYCFFVRLPNLTSY
jgi:hypothetical protein